MTGERVMDAGDHETALADQMVLSHCDYIVSTRESTMGFVAHAATYKVFFFLLHAHAALPTRCFLLTLRP